MRESNFAFPPQNRACVCITSQLYDRRALDATSALPLYNSLTHLVYLTSTSPRIREILTLDGGLERLVRILRDFCANPPRRRDAAWIYALSPPGTSSSDDLPTRIEHRISPTVFDPEDDDSDFFLESSSRAELEKAAHHLARFRIGAQRPSEAAFQKPHPTAHSVPYIPTPGVPFPYQIDPLAARTFSLAFQSVVNIGVRGSEHIRRRVVQAGALGVVSCILAVWLKGKGFAIGPSATGSGAPRESREVRVRRREEALERQRAMDLARALETAAADGTRRPAAPTPRLSIAAHPSALQAGSRQANPSSDEGDEEMSASDLGPSPTPPPVRVGAAGRSMSNDSDGSYVGVPSAAAVIGAPDPTPAGAFAPHAAPVQRSHSHSGHTISYNSGPYDPSPSPIDGPVSVPARTASPIPIASGSHPSGRTISPMMGIGRAISPNTAQSSDASANATPVGSGTPTGSVVVPGRERSGTVVGRPVWDVPRTGAWDGQAGWEAPAAGGATGRVWDAQGGRAGWPDAQRGGWDDDGAPDEAMNAGAVAGRRGTITRRPRRERDTDGDDTEADMEEGTGQGERRTVGIVDAADGDGAMAMDMMGEGVGVGVVALEQNDDLAMGAPPGAPGAVPVGVGVGVGVGITTTPRARVPGGNELTPRAGLANLGVGAAEAAVPEPRRVGVSNPGINPGPYGDEEVLFSLQLLAYLSKYPHVRQAFYETPPTLRALVDASSEPRTAVPATSTAESPNVFSLVERFTFRPSPSETTLPRLPQEIQYWAGVIMRNACRKDDQRGGIRQCANMLCGRWEDFPREFAKCRRCRKAKYCGKECQSKAWAEGHRFWCSAREEDDGATVVARGQRELPNAPAAVATEVEVPTRRGLTTTVTRALVNMAGGMTGRNNNTANANAAATAAPTQTRAGAAVSDLMVQGNLRAQQQGAQPARATGIVGAAVQGPPSAGVAGRGAGMRVVRPLALPANARGAGNWGGARSTIFGDNAPSQTSASTQTQTQTQDAGPSRRVRVPETARRRSGTMPSGGGGSTSSFDFTLGNPRGADRLEVGGTLGFNGRVIPPGAAGGEQENAWRVVPVQRVSPTPSAPHTTPLHTGRALEDEGDDMVLG
ncbi:hypothetical protein BDV93DRAFT_479918 [Ceratobasidium sp. AG-I]|nr:hypothetical protein BDV93DRAFT_479918 [Ceratobasidium sp. AG-I]